jgi:hypothetical protein
VTSGEAAKLKLVVEPAASLVGLVLGSGVRVVLDNQGEAPYYEAATLRAWRGIGEVIPPAVERVKRALGKRPKWSSARGQRLPRLPYGRRFTV